MRPCPKGISTGAWVAGGCSGVHRCSCCIAGVRFPVRVIAAGVMGGGRRCLASAPGPGPRQSPGRCFLLVKYLFEFSVGVGRAGLLISGLGASVRCPLVLLLRSRAWALVPDGRFALGCQFPASLTHPPERSGSGSTPPPSASAAVRLMEAWSSAVGPGSGVGAGAGVGVSA